MGVRYHIAEVARRTGFPTSTLRYYEDIGLLPVAERSEGGYRRYDEDVIRRLRFIARAKQLGCTLDEITVLVRAWDGEHCAEVATRLHALIDEKISETAQRMTELTAFAHELQRAANALSQPVAGAGPCDDRCACMAVETEDEAIACTLDAGAMPERLADWQRVLAAVRGREKIAGGLRLQFADNADPAEIARLAGAEQRCCRFFTFSLTLDARGTGLEVRAPETAAEVIAALFGIAA